jgi:hypothetical protein
MTAQTFFRTEGLIYTQIQVTNFETPKEKQHYANNHEDSVSIGKEVQRLDTKISVTEYVNILIA